jgi:hypothetical protein
VIGEVAVVEEVSVVLHLQQVVLTLPYEGDCLELIDAVSLLVDSSDCRSGCSQEERVYELFPPFDDTLDYMKT